MEDLGTFCFTAQQRTTELFYLIITRDNVSKEQPAWHNAAGKSDLNRRLEDPLVLMAYCASGFFSLTSDKPLKFLCLYFFASDKQEEFICALRGKCAQGVFNSGKLYQRSCHRYIDAGMKDTGEKGGGSGDTSGGLSDPCFSQTIPFQFQNKSIQAGSRQSTLCLSFPSLTWRQYSFFVSIFQSAFQGMFFLLWCIYTKTNALLNPEVLKIKCRAIPQVIFFTHKQLYLVMEDSRQECI